MKIKPPIKEWYERISNRISINTVLISVIVFIITSLIVTHLSRNYYDAEFAENVLVEAHGMLFDILVIGILILALNKLAEKRIENKRYLDEIDDFRDWQSEEAAYRIAGNLKRLKRNGFKGEINLRTCYLSPVDLTQENLLDYISPYLSGINLVKADLRRANLREADLGGANLEKTNLMGAKCEKANLEGANLWDASLEAAKLEKAMLREAILVRADLRCAVLREANLYGANLRTANLRGADLEQADLREADLEKARNLTLVQLSTVKTLYNALLDPALMEQVEEKYPHLLEKPNV